MNNLRECGSRVSDGREQMADQILEIKGVTQSQGRKEMCINFSSFLISECLRSGFSRLRHLY